jgi:Phage tail assembly chaperone proteins, E, or 41 or 14
MAGEREKRTVSDDETPKPKIEPEAPKTAEPKKGDKVFKLRKMIQAHGEELMELTLREPKASDIMRAGYPIIMKPIAGGGIQLTPDEQKMTNMMVELAAVPPSSIGQMHPADWATVSIWLSSFFGPDWDQVMS